MNASMLIGIVLILFGFSSLFGLPFGHVLFAILLIALGVYFITGRGRRQHHRFGAQSMSASAEDSMHEVAILSSLHKKISSQAFAGGSAVLVLSGGEIDLRDCKAASSELEIEITTVLGGVKVWVPREWSITARGASILGGYDNKAQSGGSVSVTISGAAVLGGVEIVN